MKDLKEMYMDRADELAMMIYDKEFYDLTKEQQGKLWVVAESHVVNEMVDRADCLRKAEKENCS